jgi:glycosyltransferase involved in cell wall biosynthesis
MIVPSREEGFGLPVMEAAALGLPVIARDIPVFREIAGDRCFYFGESPDRDLARRIGEWLALPAESRQRYTTRGLAIGWQEAARRLRDKIEHDHRDFTMHVPAPATPTAQPPGPPSANGTTQ